MDSGQGFGEIALLYPVTRTATVTATSETTLLSIGREAFLTAMHAHPATSAAAERIAGALLEEARWQPARLLKKKTMRHARLGDQASVAVGIRDARRAAQPRAMPVLSKQRLDPPLTALAFRRSRSSRRESRGPQP